MSEYEYALQQCKAAEEAYLETKSVEDFAEFLYWSFEVAQKKREG